MLIRVSNSDLPGKKLKIVIEDEDTNRTKTIHIGQRGANDFIKWNKISPSLAEERKTAYINRHQAREDWTKSGIKTAGFWSRWLLWNKRSLSQSISDVRKRFNLNVVNN
jgi:hypothetical protein